MILLLASCFFDTSVQTDKMTNTNDGVIVKEAAAADCSKAKNTCADYSTSWVASCPAGSRCLTFKNNSPTETVALSYQIGCNGDGTPGAPQCSCTSGPMLAPGASSFFVIIDGDYASCLPSWTPSCLTAGLAVIANATAASCAAGTRVEFTAGNSADVYDHMDSFDLDIEKAFYSIPVTFTPDITCATDHANHDCRPLVCDSSTCPDAYSDPTSGGCGYSPQVGCQDTFSQNVGLTVTYYPDPMPKSCQDAKACP
jgi:hypothetical protein